MRYRVYGVIWLTIILFVVSPAEHGVAQRSLEDTRSRVLALRDSMGQRGEFETTEQYESRVRRQRRQVVKILWDTYRDTLSVRFGRYKANEEQLPVVVDHPHYGGMRFLGQIPLTDTLTLTIPPNEAKKLKENRSVRGMGEFWLTPTGKIYVEGSLSLVGVEGHYTTEPSSVRIQPILSSEQYNIRFPDWVVLSPDNEYIALPWAVLRTQTGSTVRKIEGRCSKPSFSSDGKYYVCGWFEESAFGKNQALKLFIENYDSGTTFTATLRDSLPPGDAGSLALDFEPGTHRLAVEGAVRDTSLIRVLRVTAGGVESQSITMIPGPERILGFEFSPDGGMLAVRTQRWGGSTEPHRLWIYDTKTWKPLNSPRSHRFKDFGPNGERYLTLRRLRETRSGEVVTALSLFASLDGIAPLRPRIVSPSGDLIVGQYLDTTVFWNAERGSVVGQIDDGWPLAFLAPHRLITVKEGGAGGPVYQVHFKKR